MKRGSGTLECLWPWSLSLRIGNEKRDGDKHSNLCRTNEEYSRLKMWDVCLK